eukprot:TRINITY_DN271_c0_g1_i1.p1 TRINITY_DN271_c0_g1~~TRINITY_DN271_c0_g1_i1.p1  ORF type:complete len:587 (-),score=110.67 TRINITY_DN271_c0_g1_i1:284-2044(-)
MWKMWKRARHQQRPVWETDEDETESSSSDDDSDDEDEHECLYKSLEAQLKRLLQLPWLAQRQEPPHSAQVLKGAHEQLHVVAAEIHGLRMAANAIPDIRGVTALRAAADMLEDRLEQVTGLCAEQKQQLQQEQREGSQAQQRQARLLANSSVAAVFNDKQLVELVLSFVGPGYWLYVAGVSRLLRGRYMAAVVHDWSDCYVAPPLFKTSISSAAVQSTSTLRMAAKSSDTYKLLQTRTVRTAVGRAACLELLDVAATEADMSIDRIMLLGAAPTANVAFLNKLLSRCDECDSFVGRVWALFGVYAVENVKNWRALFPCLVQQAKRKSWPEWYTTALCHRAAQAGRLEVLQWLLSEGTQLFGPFMPEVRYTKLRNHMTLYEVVSKCFPDYYEESATSSQRVELGLLDSAVYAGKLDIVKWVSEQGGQHPFTARTAVIAAEKGHLEVLQWLHTAPMCPFEAQSIITATLEDSPYPIATFKWLHEVGQLPLDSAPTNTHLLVTAVKQPRLQCIREVVQWLLQKGAEWPQSPGALVVAGTWNSYDVARAIELGCPWGSWPQEACEVIQRTCFSFDLEAVHRLGCPCSCIK